MSKSRFMLGALIAGLAASLFAQEPVPPRVALLATTLNADSEKFLDVATAELTARGGIELVERQAIRQVLGEQALALQQDASGVAAGRLLRADVVGVLETTPDGKEAGGFAVLDTATGVSYWNEGFDQADVEGVAGEIARGVAAALEKRGRAGALGTVCVLGARNAEFPRSLDTFCETTAYLLERRLVANPGLATLDRRRLETVVSENNLPGVESKSADLRASLRLVELDFRRGAADGEVKVLARVTDAGGALIAQPEVAGPQDAAELAERLQAASADVLHAAPQAAVGNRAQEANRFRTQGRILRDRGLEDQSIQAFHAAYALDPGTSGQLEEYVSQVMDYAYSLADKGIFAQALELGRAALDIEDRWQVRHAHMGENDEQMQAQRPARRSGAGRARDLALALFGGNGPDGYSRRAFGFEVRTVLPELRGGSDRPVSSGFFRRTAVSRGCRAVALSDRRGIFPAAGWPPIGMVGTRSGFCPLARCRRHCHLVRPVRKVHPACMGWSRVSSL